MGRQQSDGHNADRVVRDNPNFEVGDLVMIKDSLRMLGIISEVKGKIQGANHDWNKYYYMVIPAGSLYPVPVWNKELELIRKAK
tara:strand:+ start:376 stop:627 length:252 start_codon:yes stop_codon:yes gene_type:complete